MRRRDKAGGTQAKTQRRKMLRRRNTAKVARRRKSSTADATERIALLTRERDEALERQTATSEVLSVISSSPGELQPVLDTIVQTAARLCKADFAMFFRLHEGKCYVGATNAEADIIKVAREHPIVPTRASCTGRAVLERRAVHVLDAMTDPEYAMPDYRLVANNRTMLGVPLLREGVPLGTITLWKTRVEPFTEKQIELITTFAAQAVIAIENTRLLNELRQRTGDLTESLQQQTATADVLQVISRSAFDLQPVFDTVAESSVRLCGADKAFIFRFDGELLRMVAGYNASPELTEFVRQNPIRPGRHTGTARAALERRTVHIPDVLIDPEYTYGAKNVDPIRTVLGVPIVKGDELLGVIMIYRLEVKPFAEKQIALVETFADQAAIAIENVRLFDEVQTRTRDLTESLQQQTATADVLKVISRSTFDLQVVLDTLVESAVQLCEAERGLVFRREGETYKSVAYYNYSPEFKAFHESHPITPGRGTAVGRTALEGKTVQIVDILADPEYTFGEAQKLGGGRATLAVPLLREGAPIGAFSLQRTEPRPYTGKQIELVETFANQAVIAIENARLLSELRQRTDDLSEALEQQTATSEVLQVISSSPGELKPVFQAMLEKAVRICDANFGNLFLREGDAFRIGATYGAPAYVEFMRTEQLFHLNPKMGLGRLVRTKELYQLADISAVPTHGDKLREATIKLAGARTLIALPMLKDNEVIGAIVIYRQEVRPFTDKQIELVKNFAAQAVIAIENTRLLSELRVRTDDLSESLEQQTATSEVLKVISSSPGELEPVFDAMLEKAMRVCEATFGHLATYDGARFHTVAIRGVPAPFAEFRRQNPPEYGPGTGVARLLSGERVVHFADAADTDVYRHGDPNQRAVVDLGGARTMLVVPLLKDEALRGFITLYRQEVKPFTNKQIALVQNFAAQAVIAIENVRLFDEVQRRTRELSQSVDELRALGEVSQAVNSTLDLETVLTTIVGHAVQLSRTDAGAIYVFDEKAKEFRLHATYGMSEAMIAAISDQHIGLGDGSNIAAATVQRKPIQVPDTHDEPNSAVNEIILREGYRSILIIPLLRPDNIVGALVVRRKTPGEFARTTIALLQTFADQSVVALQNARLYENVETRTRELAASLEDLRATQDRLVQTQKLASLGQLTAGIAHEIKNPLNFVNNFSAVSVELIDELRHAFTGAHLDSNLRAEISEIADTLQGNLDKVVHHGKRADAIVKNMLLHSREGSGEHRPVDINALVEEGLNLAYHGARAEKQGFNIKLERSFDPNAGEVDVFPQDITRVLLNLFSNGFYAATNRSAETNGDDYEPTLAAATKNRGDRVEIIIRDNGMGIPADVREKMFNPFFTTKPAGEGTGLGLSISHDIVVKQHGGSIEVETQSGEFTEIKIVLPRAGALPQ